MERHRPDEGLHNPRGGIGRVPVVRAHRQRHRMSLGPIPGPAGHTRLHRCPRQLARARSGGPGRRTDDRHRQLEIPAMYTSLEQWIEDWLADDISVLDPNLLVIGRQVRSGGILNVG